MQNHLRLGWIGLALFMGCGLLLEGLLGLKAAWYVDSHNTLRRELWTLAHAHGTLLSLVQLAYAFTLSKTSPPALAGTLLTIGWILLPAGFFLGGLTPHHGDPGLGIWLVPAGGVALIAAAVLTAVSLRAPQSD